MANETEISNSAHPTDVISDGISAALVKKVVLPPLIYKEDLPVGTAVKLFRKDGSLTAEDINESAAYSFSASSELTQSTVSATAIKTVCVSKLTAEAEQFGLIDQAKIVREQGAAIARQLDAAILALFSGFTSNTGVTSTSILTVADVMQAVYSVVNADAAPVGGMLTAVLHHKGLNEIKKEVMAAGAAVFSQPSMITLLQNAPQTPNGYAGSLPGLNIFHTSGMPTTGGDNQQLVFNGEKAFAGMYAPSVQVRPTWVGSGGFWTELASFIFSKVVEWNDAAAVILRSDS